MRKTSDVRAGIVRFGRGSQLGAEQQSRRTHRLIDEDLLLVFVTFAPFQNIFESDHGRPEIERGLQEQCELERRNRTRTDVD